MQEVQGDKRLRIVMPVPLWLRLFFMVIALFCIVTPAWELHRGVWPPNWASPFFLFIIGGAWSIGIPAAWAGITGSAESWTILPGRILIVRRNPFAFWRYTFRASDLAPFEIVERVAMEGDNTFAVRLVTRTGKHFQTHDFAQKESALRQLERIEALFRS